MIALNSEIINDSFLFRQQAKQEFYTTRLYNVIGVCNENNNESLSIRNASIYNNIRDFLNLNDNWDDDNAVKPTEEAVNQALSIIEEIDSFNENAYFASPGPNGEISIELRKDNREVELIIYDNKKVFLKFEGNHFIEQGDLNNLDNILNWIDAV